MALMSSAMHETIGLSRGKHRSPEDGACVMELAALLAGEPFSDHPRCVSPVIGSFLRAYNDAIDPDRRQDLYRYATKVIGTRGTEELERARARMIARWVVEQRCTGRLGSARQVRFPGLTLPSQSGRAGARAVRAIRRHTDESHAAALALIDALVGIGELEQEAPTFRSAQAPAPGSLVRGRAAVCL